jgi:hypothetical protein
MSMTSLQWIVIYWGVHGQCAEDQEVVSRLSVLLHRARKFAQLRNRPT